MELDKMVKVWDLPVRLFHWSLAAAFVVAYLTEDDWLSLHTFAGYTVAGLIVFRVLWGIVGSRHARFGDFVRSPAEVFAYVKSIFGRRPRRYLGHNPAGGAMVVALLVTLTLTALTGLATYGAVEGAGPLAALLAHSTGPTADVLEEAHELLANLALLLVFAHVGGVVVASLQHRENLPRSMVTGLKSGPEPGR